MGKCEWCNGTGVQYVERGSSLCYSCPDCNGSGHLPDCDICGEEYTGDYCTECYSKCKECGEICPVEYMSEDGLCDDCAAELQNEK